MRVKKLREIVLFFLSAILLLGCENKSKKSNVESIKIDLSKSISLDLNKDNVKTIDLISNDSSIIVGNLDKILFTDKAYFIESQNNILIFDRKTGTLINSIRKRGKARNEYISIWDFWLEDNVIYIYDFNSEKILKYNDKGIFIKSDTLKKSNPFQLIIKMDSNYYIGKQSFSNCPVKELALYDKNFKFIKNISDFTLRSGIKIGDPFYKISNNSLLYNRCFINTIYNVSLDSVCIKYKVDFMKNNIPKKEIFKDEYDYIDLLKEIDCKYASLIRNLYESKEYFCFTFLFKGNKYIAIYNIKSKIINTYLLKCGDNRYSAIYFNDDSVILFYQKLEGGTSVQELKIATINHSGN